MDFDVRAGELQGDGVTANEIYSDSSFTLCQFLVASQLAVAPETNSARGCFREHLFPAEGANLFYHTVGRNDDLQANLSSDACIGSHGIYHVSHRGLGYLNSRHGRIQRFRKQTYLRLGRKRSQLLAGGRRWQAGLNLQVCHSI